MVCVFDHKKLRFSSLEKLTFSDDVVCATRAKRVSIAIADSNWERDIFTTEPIICTKRVFRVATIVRLDEDCSLIVTACLNMKLPEGGQGQLLLL